MKRLFILLFAICTAAVATAQIEQAIIIDKATFKAVNSGVLTGVNIDPIGVDSSRRPCARIKMKVNRMTREEIDGLSMRIRTNNECIKCKTADYDNGLIIEMTAKNESRFYLHHDKFGDSNEVELNLEANKEYYIEASLNQQFSITVASNVADAEVYVDNQFRGRTNSDGYLTVEGLLAGEHALKLIYSGVDYNQTILISSTSIFFRQDIDLKSTSSQYLVIKTTPKNALVEINGEVVENSTNGASKILKPGAFTYTVTAQNYHPKSGTGVMRGEKITIDVELAPAFGHLAISAESDLSGAQVYVNNSQRGTLPLSKNIILKSGTHSVRIVKSMYKPFEQSVKITDGNITTITAALEPNFAQVTLNADKGVELWVDNTKVGVGTWSGKLEIGDHIVECRKASHEPSSQTLSITGPNNVVRNFEPLKPIYGTLNISSNPIGATITIDGEKVGETPMIKNDVLVGKRVVEISMKGYQTEITNVEVVEGKSSEVSPKLSTTKSATILTPGASQGSPTTKSLSKTGNLLQGAIGLSGGWGPSGNTLLSVPIDLRIGRCDQLFNLFVTAKYNFKKAKDKELNEQIEVTQWAVGGNVRANIIRNLKNKSYSAIFLDLGGYYNFNTKCEHVDSYNAKIDASELLNKNSVSAFGALGIGGKLGDVALYFQYDFSPAFSINSPDVNMPEAQPIESYSDSSISSGLKDAKFNIGIMVRMFFNGGFFKK